MPSYKSKLQALLKNQIKQPSVTFYIPTHPDSNSQTINADQTRFKNALQAIRLHPDYDDSVLGDSMTKLDQCLNDMDFWKHQKRSLAVLANADTVEYFQLPFEVTEAHYLEDSFILSPLLIVDAIDKSYYVLDVNFTEPRLFYSQDGDFKQVNQTDMPGSFEDEVGKDEYQKQLQNKPGSRIGYHGHTEDDAVDEETRRYLKSIADSVENYLDQDEQAPLLLAGTDNRTGNIKKELSYKNLLPTTYSGSVEKMNAHELYEATSPLVREYFIQRTNQLVEKLSEAAPEYVAIGKDEIVEIANISSGRIESLFLPVYRRTKDGVQTGGVRSIVIELPKEDIDQIESTVMAVINQGGEIVPVEIGAHEVLDRVKAFCRYA